METSWPRGRRKIFQAEGVERAKALGGTRQVFLKAELQVAAGAVAGAAGEPGRSRMHWLPGPGSR